MKMNKILFVALCLISTVAEAQVVYGENEKDYVKTTSVTYPQSLPVSDPSKFDGNVRYQLSGIGDNWFASVQGGISFFLGAPKGCGDFFGRKKPTMLLSLGKWHSPFFGTRLVYQGLKFVISAAQSVSYQNFHGDLMLNVSSFFHRQYDPLPKWDFVPYLGAGMIRNADLHKTPFALSYGVLCSYRVSSRIHVTAELGCSSTFQTFDGNGKDNHFGDNLFQASIGLTASIGRLGWEKKKRTVKEMPLQQEVIDLTPYPRNDYDGLRMLRERLASGDTIQDSNENIAQFTAPILFFFKINSTQLIDKQQKVNIDEIAAVVKEYGLYVKVIGAADSKTGTPKYNRKLSIKRAKYIAKLLIKAGCPKKRMTGASQGGINIYKPYTANRHTCVILYQKK